MHNKRRAAVDKVATELFSLEKSLDATLTIAARFCAAMTEARMEANLSAVVGQEAFSRTVETYTALAEARGHCVATHQLLDETKVRIGLRTYAVGDGTQKPDRPMGLSLVEAA